MKYLVLSLTILCGTSALQAMEYNPDDLDHVLALSLQEEEERQALEEALALSRTQQQNHRSEQPVLEQQAHDSERHDENFVIYQRGDIPIILSAPHGGSQSAGAPRIPGIPNRVLNRALKDENCWDDGSLELALQTSDEIYRLIGKRPYIVVARFPRTQIDANRGAGPGRGNRAYQDLRAKPYYDAYHNRIAAYVDEIKDRFSHGLLLDIHGQGAKRWTIYRGTCNRATVHSMINRFGEESLTGPHSIMGVLAHRNNTVYPNNDRRHDHEHGSFSGGYIVQRYGSIRYRNMDAIQLEFGAGHRNEGRAECARDLATAVIEHLDHYLG